MTAPQQKKHQQHILATDALYYDRDDVWEAEVTAYDPEKWLEEIVEHTAIMQRAKLETTNLFRQLLPYMIFFCRTPDGKTLFYPYKRLPGIGETTLIDKVSVGYGGHVDGLDVIWTPESIVNVKKTLLACALREKFEEVRPQEEMMNEWMAVTPELSGLFICSNANETDEKHLAVIILTEVPYGMVLTCVEDDELEAMMPMSANDLLEGNYELESWTKKYLEYFTTMPEVTDEEIEIGFGNEAAARNPIAPPAVTKTAVDEAVAVLWSNFNRIFTDHGKVKALAELPQYKVVLDYVSENRGKYGFVHVAGLLIDAIGKPELGERFSEEIKVQTRLYLETRFAPDEMKLFEDGGLTIQATPEETKISDQAFAILKSVIELKRKIFEDEMYLADYQKALEEIIREMENIPTNEFSDEALYAAGQMIHAHSSTYKHLADNLDSPEEQVLSVYFAINPSAHQVVWTEAEKKVALLFSPMEEVMEVLNDELPGIVEKIQQDLADACADKPAADAPEEVVKVKAPIPTDPALRFVGEDI